MPQDITDVSAFTDPVTAPQGLDAANATEIVAGIQKLANRTRYLLDEIVYTTPRARTTIISAMARDHETGTVAQLNTTGPLQLQTNTMGLTFDIGQKLPDGATITKVRALVDPGAARSGTNRMALILNERTLDFTTPGTGSQSSIGSTVYDDTTTNVQVIDSGTISASVSKATGKTIFASIQAGNDAATNNDRVYGIEIQWTDPGPRNY